jgi:hypothetical protein
MDFKKMMPPNPVRRPTQDLADLINPLKRPTEESAPMAPDVETVFHPKRTSRTPRRPRP